MDLILDQDVDTLPAGVQPGGDVRHDIGRLLDGFSVEITSDEAETVTDIASLIPVGTRVFLPFLPNSTLADSVPAAERLAREGMVPVLHVAARRLQSQGELTDVLGRLRETASLDSVLVIAGDINGAKGPYKDAMSLLETGLLEQHGIKTIGVSGYPEAHPVIGEAEIWGALAAKCAYAQVSSAHFQIVSQFTFSAQSIIAWEIKLRETGVMLPVHLSVPGPAKMTTLLGYARRCGVSASLRQLTRNRKAIAGLATVRAPDRLITLIARHAAHTPGCLIAGVHFNTFGGFDQTAHWVKAVVQGRFVMNSGNEGFSLEDS